MEQKKWELILALVLLLVVSFVAGDTKLLETSAIPADEIVIGIDAGHGGVDSGKVGVNNVLEKDINLKIAFKLKEELESQGIRVVMSREDDNGLYSETDSNKKQADMKKRCEIFDGANCTLVVSIHQNSYHLESVSGPQVFYYATSVKGKLLAESLQQKLVEDLKPEKERLPKANDSYYLLKKVSSPIVIVECGFLTNWKEATRLNEDDYQNTIAKSISEGIMLYLKEVQ